jgi:hypothetical protein
MQRETLRRKAERGEEEMKVRYKGTTFGGGVLGLTDGKTYECVGVEYDLLRIIDDEGEDYLYSASAPAPLNGKIKPGKWEVVEDDDQGTLSRLISKENA